MAKLIYLLALTITTNLFAATDFSANLIPGTNIVSISIADDGVEAPFEAGDIWKIMIGTDQRKYIDQDGFSLECDGIKNANLEIFGSCTLNIPMNLFQKVGDQQVFKLTKSAGSRINRYFTDNAYLSIQGGRVYLSSYNIRREFYFGIQDDLIKR